MAKITGIDLKGTLAGKVRKGEELLAFNSQPFEDILDYIYYDAEDTCVLTVKGKDGTVREVTNKKKRDYDTMGLDFDDTVSLCAKECYNNCIFCFVRQLPKGLRKTLYIKDDDYRLSFTSGCYITCTNLKEKDIQRIIKYRLSPLYISVHTTDEELRLMMLGVKKASAQLPLLKRLNENGIKFHTQIVLCGGINDGSHLERSLADLKAVGAESVAVVPVGLTMHREGLYPLETLTKAEAAAAIAIVEAFYEKYPFFCYCSDEMYEIAGEKTKDAEYYGDFCQIENGVGLQAKFLSEITEELEYVPDNINRSVAVITGVSGVGTMLKVKELLEGKWKDFSMNIYPVVNKFFGETVTVTGLVTAGDIIETYKEHTFAEDEIFIPSVMLKEFEDVFLDNISVPELEKALGKRITMVAVTGEALVEAAVYGGKK